jgi:hypothetical protein
MKCGALRTLGRGIVLTFAAMALAGCAPEPRSVDVRVHEPRPAVPRDRQVGMSREAAAEYDAVIAPFVEEARRTYPEARKRYLAGLPPRHQFFVTTRLRDASNRHEQVFIKVTAVSQGMIEGTIANDIVIIDGYQRGQRHRFPESELMDWLIQMPDGSEDGNLVGRFLDYYRPGKVFAAIFGVMLDGEGRVASVTLTRMIDPSTDSAEALAFRPPLLYIRAATERIAHTRYEPRPPTGKEFYVVYVYDPLRPNEALDVESVRQQRQ